jgi:succinate dehydrogenase flavin-adding protein (antitoxin of CptAB toxin-antitoxin module)
MAITSIPFGVRTEEQCNLPSTSLNTYLATFENRDPDLFSHFFSHFPSNQAGSCRLMRKEKIKRPAKERGRAAL